uniref:Uncharacterized protein n=1 Tax=Arundo donax TaxID=35708 RepID=A0A0A8Z9I9_ARUDO
MLQSVNGRGYPENNSISCKPTDCKVAVLKALQDCLSI